jgi:predicted nucleotide-binding protein
VSRATLDGQLAERVAIGEELEGRPIRSEPDLNRVGDEYRAWNDYNETLLKRSFTTTEEAEKYTYVGPRSVSMAPSWDERVRSFLGVVHQRVQRLSSLQGRLELFEEVAEAPGSRDNPAAPGLRVFIVHGHGHAAKEAVARFVRTATSREATILHEQANEGRTIIEKFEDHAATTGFAIVLLTADDEGSERGSRATAPRARQNVIFEMGFFIGRLGRSRVAVIHEEGVELPSDMSGVLYTPLDAAGAWRLDLGREMKAAGLDVDLNKVIE